MAFVVHGMQELLDKLGRLPLATGKVVIARALRKGAEPIRQRAQELAPIDPENSEHPLREGMMTTVSEQTANEAIAKIGPSRKGFYGMHQEFGTMNHSAQPFLRPAFDERIDEAQKLIGEVLAAEIEKAVRKLG